MGAGRIGSAGAHRCWVALCCAAYADGFAEAEAAGLAELEVARPAPAAPEDPADRAPLAAGLDAVVPAPPALVPAAPTLAPAALALALTATVGLAAAEVLTFRDAAAPLDVLVVVTVPPQAMSDAVQPSAARDR